MPSRSVQLADNLEVLKSETIHYLRALKEIEVVELPNDQSCKAPHVAKSQERYTDGCGSLLTKDEVPEPHWGAVLHEEAESLAVAGRAFVLTQPLSLHELG